jgi:hypothetical protein
MRRVVWPVLTGLGVFLIALALLSRFYIPSQSIKFPLNEFTKTTLIAKGASYFSKKDVTEKSGVTLQTTNTTKGDVADAVALGSDHIAVWQIYSAVEDITNHTPVSIPAQPDTFAFDRKTGVLIPWSGNTVGGAHVSVSGQGPLFPLGTQKQNYQVFDSSLGKPVSFIYKGTATTDGVSTYVFTANVPATQVGTVTLPGSLVGMTPVEVKLPEYYSAQKTYYVDPVTGVPLRVDQNVQQVLKDSTGTTRLVLLSADFKTAPSSVAASASTDKSGVFKISLLTVILPLVLGIIGIILLLVGVVLGLRGDEDDEYEEYDEPVGATA